MLVNSNQNAHLVSQTNGVKEVGQTADDYNQQRRSSASSGISSQSEAGISFCRKSQERDFLHRVNDLRKRSFREFFFPRTSARRSANHRRATHLPQGVRQHAATQDRNPTSSPSHPQHLSLPAPQVTDDVIPLQPASTDVKKRRSSNKPARKMVTSPSFTVR